MTEPAPLSPEVEKLVVVHAPIIAARQRAGGMFESLRDFARAVLAQATQQETTLPEVERSEAIAIVDEVMERARLAKPFEWDALSPRIVDALMQVRMVASRSGSAPVEKGEG